MTVEETLRRLANAFVARDIMKPTDELLRSRSESSARDALEANPQFDIIPIVSGRTTLSYLERGQPHSRDISDRDLLDSKTPIPDVVDGLCPRRFAFVRNGRRIIGLIHFSDLNDPIVKLPIFALLEGLERWLGNAIRGLVTEAVLSELIRDPKQVDSLRQKMNSLRANGADRDWIDLMHFRSLIEAAVFFHKVALTTPDIEQLSWVRNRVAHAVGDQLVEKHEDVRRLSLVRQLCTRIMYGNSET